MISNDVELSDVIGTDEPLESHQKITCEEPSKMVCRSKHPPKWAEVSAEGATVVISTGILTATRYTDILDAALLPFIEEHYPTHHCFQLDNDPKQPADGPKSTFRKMT